MKQTHYIQFSSENAGSVRGMGRCKIYGMWSEMHVWFPYGSY